MSAKKFIVELDTDERTRLEALIAKGKASAKAILKARILLKADVAEGGPGVRELKHGIKLSFPPHLPHADDLGLIVGSIIARGS